MSRIQPPFPTGNLREWANQLVEFLLAREAIEGETLPTPLQLPHRVKGDEKAFQDGLLMYDATAGVPIYSKNGQWLKVSDDTPV